MLEKTGISWGNGVKAVYLEIFRTNEYFNKIQNKCNKQQNKCINIEMLSIFGVTLVLYLVYLCFTFLVGRMTEVLAPVIYGAHSVVSSNEVNVLR